MMGIRSMAAPATWILTLLGFCNQSLTHFLSALSLFPEHYAMCLSSISVLCTLSLSFSLQTDIITWKYQFILTIPVTQPHVIVLNKKRKTNFLMPSMSSYSVELLNRFFITGMSSFRSWNFAKCKWFRINNTKKKLNNT